jgi:hypothetical protein
MLIVLAAVHAAPPRPMSTCPLADPELYRAIQTRPSHGLLVMRNPTTADNVVSAVVSWAPQSKHRRTGWIIPRPTAHRTTDSFLLIIPARGHASINLDAYPSNETISVTFGLLPSPVLCEQTYWSEDKREEDARSFVSTNGTDPDWLRFEDQLERMYQRLLYM